MPTCSGVLSRFINISPASENDSRTRCQNMMHFDELISLKIHKPGGFSRNFFFFFWSTTQPPKYQICNRRDFYIHFVYRVSRSRIIINGRPYSSNANVPGIDILNKFYNHLWLKRFDWINFLEAIYGSILVYRHVVWNCLKYKIIWKEKQSLFIIYYYHFDYLFLILKS